MRNFDLKQFRKENGITQGDVAEYLGVRQAYVSQMEVGTKAISREKIEKLLSNPDWSYHVEEASLEIGGDSIQQNGGSYNIGKISGNAELLALRREVELLREQVAELKREKAEYWEIIKSLTIK